MLIAGEYIHTERCVLNTTLSALPRAADQRRGGKGTGRMPTGMGQRMPVTGAFALTGAMVRVLLSEQNFGASGLLTTVGMNNDQLVTYYWVLTGATA